MGIQIYGNTNNINAGIGSLSIEDIHELDLTGIATASNFKTGSSNLHSTGLTVGNALVHSTGVNVGTGATVHSPATNVLTLGTNSNERLRILSTGRVGINQTSPGSMLQVDYDEGNSEVGLRLRAYNASGSKTWQLSEINGNAGVLAIRNATNSLNALSITSGGNVYINDTPPWSVVGGNFRSLSISGENASSSGWIYLGNGAAATNADFDLTRINICNGANIVAQITGTTDTSATDTGRLDFYTRANGESSPDLRLRIKSDGTVHFYNNITGGDNKPIYLGASNDLSLFHDVGGASIIRYNHSVGGLHFRNNSNADQMMIDSSGRVIIGHTVTDDRDGYNSSLQVSGTSGDDTSISIGRWSNDQSSPALVFSKSRSTTIGSHSVLTGSEYLGAIQFQGDDGSNYHVGASIQARVENFSGGVGSDDMPTRLFFNTNGDAANITNRMIIHGRGSEYGVKYGGRVDILGYEGHNITGGSRTNVLNEQFLVCPSAADSYADSHTITFGQTKGNWEGGTTSSYDTSYGLMWFYGSQYNSTRALRAGIHYDHKGQERFKFWSSYGDIIFKTRSTSQGDYTAEECDQEPFRITDTNRVGINRGGTASVDETLDVDGGARFRSYVYIGDGFFFKSNAFGGNTNLDTGITINQGGRGGCGLLLASRNYNNGTGTSAGIYRIKWYYDGNNAPDTHHMSGDNFISFGVSASNTLTINGGGGNQLYGIINVTA